MFTLFFDTDCDITPSIAKEYGAKLISMPYEINGKEIRPYVDFEEFDDTAFYNELREIVAKGKKLPSTSALSPIDYRNYFEPEFKEGKDILYVHFSAAMSATFNALRLAKEELEKEYPGRKIHLIDTKGITLGSYAICKQIGQLYKDGKTIDEIIEQSKYIIDHQALYFFADNLKFFAKSGRVTGFQAMMGGIIGIRPIIYIGDDGKMTSIGKAVGRTKAINKLLEYVDNLGDNIKDHLVAIAHCDAPELVEKVIIKLKEKYGEDLNVEVVPVNPTAGSHCGPDSLGITFHAIHR